tara:strand:+ start:293 stop:2167 length:1875 start_codon:yes stop_codon:yes gene_type:complete
MTRTVPGSGAVIEPVFNSTYGVKDVFVEDGGSGYVATDPPKLTIGNCGTPLVEAILEPIITNGQIAAVKVLHPGEGYDPFRININNDGGGYGANAKAFLWAEDQVDTQGNVLAPAGSINYIQMLSNGDNFFTGETTAEIKGGGGSGAELRPVTGLVTGLSLEQAGANYENGDINLIVSGGGGQGATGVADVDQFGIIKQVNVTNAGEFFETPPVILLNGGGGGGARAQATVNLGAITGIDILDPGGGYAVAPQVIFTRKTDLIKKSRNRQAFNSTIYNLTGLLTDVGITDQSIYVETTDPFPGSGKILIGREVIRYTGKTPTSFTGCDRAVNFRYDQKITLDALADDPNTGISTYVFNVGDRVIRTSESSSNKIARVYDWVPAEKALYLVFEVDKLAFIDGGSSMVTSQVIDFTAGIAASSATGIEPHVLVDEIGSKIYQLTDPIQIIQDKAFEDDDELSGAGDGIPDLINTGTDFEGAINLDGGIATSLYGLEETLGGQNTSLFANGDQMSDASLPSRSPTVSVAGALGDGELHLSTIEFTFMTMANAYNFGIGETVLGSLSGVQATVVSWDSSNKVLVCKDPVANGGNYLWNKNESINGQASGASGTLSGIQYPSSVRNEPD